MTFAFAGVFALLVLARLAFIPLALPAEFSSQLNHSVSLSGVIVADPDVRQRNQQLVIEVVGHKAMRILAFAPLSQHYTYGEHVLVSGVLLSPQPFATASGRMFRYDHFLAKKGIFSLIKGARVVEELPRLGFHEEFSERFYGRFHTVFMRALFGVKHEFVKGLKRALPAPYAELAVGLLTGDQHQLDDATVTALSFSGLIWIVVLAGYHVTLIVRGVLAVFFFLPRRIALALAALCVLALVIATGASAPSVRGGMMAGLALFARGTGRTYDAVRALIATVMLVTLWNPLLIAYDLGFQLSILVTLAIVIGTPLVEMQLLWIKNSLLREVVAVSTLAQLACLPLLVWQTGQLETWAIPANILVMAFVPLVMLLSGIAGVAGVVAAPPLAAALGVPLGLPAHILLYYLLTVATFATSLPYAKATLPPFSFSFVLLAYAALAAVLYRLTRLRLRNASQSHSSLRSLGTLQRTTSYPQEHSQPYRRAPTYQRRE
jgi:competence protein ComEC